MVADYCREGIVLLAEVNLAPADVLSLLEGLLGCPPAEAFQTAHQTLRRRTTLFVCAMNPASVGGGREELPLSLQALLATVQARDPRVGKSARVSTIGLDKVYRLACDSAGASDGIAFRFVPDSREVNAALKLQSEAGGDSQRFLGVPVFQAEGLTIRAAGRKYLPIFFSYSAAVSAAQAAYSKMPGRAAATPKVEVGSFESVARAMEEAAEGSDWGSVLFVPAGSDLMNKLLGA